MWSQPEQKERIDKVFDAQQIRSKNSKLAKMEENIKKGVHQILWLNIIGVHQILWLEIIKVKMSPPNPLAGYEGIYNNSGSKSGVKNMYGNGFLCK